MAGIKPGDLWGGGPFRWIIRAVVLGTVAIVLLLHFAAGLNIFLAAIVGSVLLLVDLGVIWWLLVSGKLKIKY